MKYTSDYINSLSFDDYLDLIVKELNDNNFVNKGIGKFSINHDSPVDKRHFMLGVVDNIEALAYLRSVGLLDNGRCPSCGAPMNTGTRLYWYDRRFPERRFSLCSGCHETRFHGDGHSMNGITKQIPSASSRKGSGCILGMLLIPYNVILSLIR